MAHGGDNSHGKYPGRRPILAQNSREPQIRVSNGVPAHTVHLFVSQERTGELTLMTEELTR